MHRIIDVAVIGATGDAVDFEWQSLVNPGVHVPAGITALTGIDNEMLADAPPFERIARELRERLEGRVFVAHNVRFDYGFIRREFARLGTPWRSPNLCTVRLSRALYPEMPRHNLDAVMERHGIVHREPPSRHARCTGAAGVLAQVARGVAARTAAKRARPGEPARHAAGCAVAGSARRSSGRTGRVPVLRHREGGAEDTLLYVGKANNLRERVLDHFRAGASDAKSAEARRAGAARGMDRNRGRARRVAARSARSARAPAGVQPPAARRR